MSHAVDQRHARILSLLRQMDMRQIEIAEIIGVNEKTISRDLSQLKLADRVSHYRRGKFAVWTARVGSIKQERLAQSEDDNKRLKQKLHNMELTYACIERGNNTAMGIFAELRGQPGIKTIGSINVYIKALIKDSRVKRGQSLRISSKIERTTYQVTRYQYDGQFKDALGNKAMLMMGINPYPHKPGKPVEVKSHSRAAITYKHGNSYGVADYGGF